MCQRAEDSYFPPKSREYSPNYIYLLSKTLAKLHRGGRHQRNMNGEMRGKMLRCPSVLDASGRQQCTFCMGVFIAEEVQIITRQKRSPGIIN